jgi:hypothetical protein
MAKPTTKSQLLAEIEHERQALEQLFATISAEHMAQPDIVGPWSIKDVVAHLIAWEQLFLGWYAAGLRGEKPALPAEGFNWRQLPQLNQHIYEQYHERDLNEILERSRLSYREIYQLVESLPEEDLFTPGKHAWTGKNALVTYIAANTNDHYRWARQEIRKGLKAKGNTRRSSLL